MPLYAPSCSCLRACWDIALTDGVSNKRVAIIGGGPAGLMAAEVISGSGIQVYVYDAMPSPGRKFLLAGIGGMNITHSEPFDAFVARYRERETRMRALLEVFSPDDLRAWIHELDVETFVGSSGRVFPKEMKAAPLLRKWLHRLRQAGVKFHPRHRWSGWSENGTLVFEMPDDAINVASDAVVLALGGGSWPRLGSDGAWVSLLVEKGVSVRELLPSNCGFETEWSEHFRSRHSGEAVKSVSMEFTSRGGETIDRRGEFIVTEYGVEGGLVYALSAPLRDEILAHGTATLFVDLAPDRQESELVRQLERPRGKKSLGEHLRRVAGIHGVKAGLLREGAARGVLDDMRALGKRIKHLPIQLKATRPLDEAISSAGGIRFESLDRNGMLLELPGVFCAGEMLDWEAPTGGYLLTGCFASGRAAGRGVIDWLSKQG